MELLKLRISRIKQQNLVESYGTIIFSKKGSKNNPFRGFYFYFQLSEQTLVKPG